MLPLPLLLLVRIYHLLKTGYFAFSLSVGERVMALFFSCILGFLLRKFISFKPCFLLDGQGPLLLTLYEGFSVLLVSAYVVTDVGHSCYILFSSFCRGGGVILERGRCEDQGIQTGKTGGVSRNLLVLTSNEVNPNYPPRWTVRTK